MGAGVASRTGGGHSTSGSREPSDVSTILSNNSPEASTTSAGSFVHPVAGLVGGGLLACVFAAYT